MSDYVSLELDGPIARLRLNRPAARNALNSEMWRRIPSLVAQVDSSDAVRLLLLQGADGCFAAGADIAELAALRADRQQALAYGADMAAATDALAACRKPSLAVIDGACVGAGVALALACDLRLATADAKLGITPARLGLVYPLGDTARLIDCIGLSASKDLLFSGRLLTAEAALRLGLVDRLLAASDLADDNFARDMLAASPGSIAATKRMIARIQAGQRQDSADSRAEFPDALAGKDFAEGLLAFQQKRPPRFR